MNEPKVTEIKLDKHFRFMYSNFVISSQQKLYLILARKENDLDVIEFDFSIYKYGYPNDEVGHPLMKYGLGFYGFYEVENSKWIEELRLNNSYHSSHMDSIYDKKQHFIAKFKDVTLEVISYGYELKTITQNYLIAETMKEMNILDND
ncbi:hypothetical protein [Mariniflexile rhizosphaerae]|uniref:hypothetical protein n=1 Tax=unclassified Mariniflexile TaxID=2643887 RepID=UPI000E3CAC60|nr:hypothetical protein [Mariniflexile sp. TRM1-10]